MRRIKPLSIYPPADLRGKVETIASELGRSANQQVLRFIRAGVRRIERRQQPKKGPVPCHA